MVLIEKAKWQGLAGDGRAWQVLFDGTYIYALVSRVGLDTSYVVKINPITMAEVSRFTYAADSQYAYFNGTYIYVL